MGRDPDPKLRSGPYIADPTHILGRLMAAAQGRAEAFEITGTDYATRDGTGLRDYIHVVDLAAGHLAALAYLIDHDGYHVWNLGTGRPQSVLDIIHAYEAAAGVQIPYEIVARRPGDVAASYADPTRAARELGWTARRGLDEMCADTWRWQSQNPHGYAGAPSGTADGAVDAGV